jgi:hypothetical protein
MITAHSTVQENNNTTSVFEEGVFEQGVFQ